MYEETEELEQTPVVERRFTEFIEENELQLWK